MPEDYSRLVTDEWDFGENGELAEKLKELVLSGEKTATTGLYSHDSKVPVAGDYAAILDSDKKRFCIIRYTHVQVKPFLEVDYEYVKLEGEGDRDIEEWRKNFRHFFRDEPGGFKDTSLVVCEEFKLVQIL
jgi:uncharacterized protein YhfF